jgi:hypothetical protein
VAKHPIGQIHDIDKALLEHRIRRPREPLLIVGDDGVEDRFGIPELMPDFIFHIVGDQGVAQHLNVRLDDRSGVIRCLFSEVLAENVQIFAAGKKGASVSCDLIIHFFQRNAKFGDLFFVGIQEKRDASTVTVIKEFFVAASIKMLMILLALIVSFR